MNPNLLTGLVFNIQRYSIDDGPGIRTTVFLKGCPLRCVWCHNPEGLRATKEIRYYQNKCIGCGTCIKVCARYALVIGNKKCHLERNKCNVCGRCSNVCPTNALKTIGEEMTIDGVANEIAKDAIFYKTSRGGVTISGGEPLSQFDFCLALLKELKKRRIHTALDTSGWTTAENLKTILRFTDLILYDLKICDRIKHIKYTGVDNKLIISNLLMLTKLTKRIICRIPLIPDLTDDRSNLKSWAKFLSSLKNPPVVELLKYNQLAGAKYEMVGREYTLSRLNRINAETDFEKHKNIFLSAGLSVI